MKYEAVMEVQISPSDFKEYGWHGLHCEDWRAVLPKKKKKVGGKRTLYCFHNYSNRVTGKKRISQMMPKKLLAVKAICTAMQNPKLVSFITEGTSWIPLLGLHHTSPWPGEREREQKRELHHPTPVTSLSFFLQSISSRGYPSNTLECSAGIARLVNRRAFCAPALRLTCIPTTLTARLKSAPAAEEPHICSWTLVANSRIYWRDKHHQLMIKAKNSFWKEQLAVINETELRRNWELSYSGKTDSASLEAVSQKPQQKQVTVCPCCFHTNCSCDLDPEVFSVVNTWNPCSSFNLEK